MSRLIFLISITLLALATSSWKSRINQPFQEPGDGPKFENPGQGLISPPLSCLANPIWYQTPLLAHDVGIGAEGDIYALGTDGRLYSYNFVSNTYSLVEGDIELGFLHRLDVDEEGTPYVITDCGFVYYLSCYNSWVKLSGCAKDIGVGRSSDVWKIGCDPRQNGYGIWKLFCKCEYNCGNDPLIRSCIRYRGMKFLVDPTQDRRKCYWVRTPGAGERIDASPDGNAVIVQSEGEVKRWDGLDWQKLGPYLAKDVTVSNEGMVIITGKDSGIYFLKSDKGNDSEWCFADVGCTQSISAGPYSQPAAIPCASEYDPYVVLSQKYIYN